jgi:hypothetical protein
VTVPPRHLRNESGGARLPNGDKAVLRLGDGDSTGLLFFVDRDKACTPMNAPPALLSLMEQIAVGDTNHQAASKQVSLS